MDKEISKLIDKYNIDLNNISIQTIKDGINVELEHGYKAGLYMNVTNDDIDQTFKIAMAHIDEFPDYYERLEKMEKEADAFWKNKIIKPNYYYDYSLVNKTWYKFNSDDKMIIKNNNVAYIENHILYSGNVYTKDNKKLMIYIKNEEYEVIRLENNLMILKGIGKLVTFVTE